MDQKNLIVQLNIPIKTPFVSIPMNSIDYI